jgi:hypothetical protein
VARFILLRSRLPGCRNSSRKSRTPSPRLTTRTASSPSATSTSAGAPLSHRAAELGRRPAPRRRTSPRRPRPHCPGPGRPTYRHQDLRAGTDGRCQHASRPAGTERHSRHRRGTIAEWLIISDTIMENLAVLPQLRRTCSSQWSSHRAEMNETSARIRRRKSSSLGCAVPDPFTVRQARAPASRSACPPREHGHRVQRRFSAWG